MIELVVNDSEFIALDHDSRNNILILISELSKRELSIMTILLNVSIITLY